MGIFDVPAALLIEEVAKDLKEKIQKPEFTVYVKTGAHAERTPNNDDWFYVRNASILYQIYKNGSTGTGSLRTYYGGRRNRGVKPEHKRKASGKVIRVCLQSLEKQGLLKKEKKGRIITGQGEKLLFTKAKELQHVVQEQEKKKLEERQERIDKAKQRIEKAHKEKVRQEQQNAQEQKEVKKEEKGKDEHGRKPEGKKA